MFFITPQDFLYFIAGLCILVITVFLSWALFEAARLLRQANEVADKTRQAVDHMERLALSASEKLTSAASYLGLIIEGGRQALSLLRKRKKGKRESEETE